METQDIVELKNITMRFPGVLALDNVNMSVQRGSVHALVGENGAGKSTLMKILAGRYQEYQGAIYLNGERVFFKNEKDALAGGIAIVPQELNPIPELSIAENIFLGREPVKRGFLDKKRRANETHDLMLRLGLDYDIETKMVELSVAQKQMVEIIKAISRDAKLIIMDEPTSALTNTETVYLFEQIELLKKHGISIIFISHKLDEVYQICNDATVLRDGKLIDNIDLRYVDKESLIAMMVGREVNDIYPKLPKHSDVEVLKIKSLNGLTFNNINFSLKRGEILGFAGMVGSGRSEIIRSIFGMDPILGGTIELEGKPVQIKNTRDAIKNGIAMISEDRSIYGFVGIRSIQDNIALPNCDMFAPRQWLEKKKIYKATDEISTKLKVKASSWNALVGTLSGGNQQKMVLSKWLIRDIKVLLLDEPTRGIDVGAKQEIYKLIVDLVSQGMSVILISSELPEVIAMSHRLMVLSDGRFVGELNHEEATQDVVMKKIVEGNAL
ncbi:MAG: sugar ABC transporter ATP-binding protein [Flexilinea sp.]